MNHKPLTINSRNGATLSLIDAFPISNKRKNRSFKKGESPRKIALQTNTVILVKIQSGTVSVGDKLVFKNTNWQIISRTIKQIEIEQKKVNKASAPKSIGILLSKTSIKYFRNFINE